MRAALFAALGLPLAEVVVLLLAGQAVGFWPLLAWLVAAAVIGVALMRGAGTGVLGTLRQAQGGGRADLTPVLGGLVRGLAGLLLLIPGLITDAVALALLLPAFRRWIADRVGRRRHGPTVIDGEWRPVTEPQDRFPPR